MARKTIKVEIPESSPNKLLELLKCITEKHQFDPENSPIKGPMMDDFLLKQVLASEKRKEAKRLSDLSQAMLGEADQILGTGPGQSRQSEGTLLNHLTYFRDQLLLHFRGNEQKMKDYGFKVTLGEAKTPVRKPK
jgi:hypothetical protein